MPGRSRRAHVFVLLTLLLGCLLAAGRRSSAEPLGSTSPTVYNLIDGDADFAVFDNARNPGRISSIAIGDLDGDTFAELFLGAPYAYGFQQQVGQPVGMVYVVYAGFSLAAVPKLDLTLTTSAVVDPAVSCLGIPGAAPPGVSGFQIQGDLAGMRFGSALACGDFDGDGTGDFAIAAPRRLSDLAAGRVYVIKGDPAAHYLVDLPAMRNYGRVLTLVGPDRPADAYFGERLLFVDFDNDGLDDLVVGSPRAGSGGEVCILYGRPFTSATLTVSEIPTTDPLFTLIEAEAPGDWLGAALDAADLSGDGRADLIIGAPLNDTTARDAGKVYVFFGADRDTTAGLPLPARVDLSSYTADLVVLGPIGDEAAGSAVAAGDLDGDALADLAVGAPYADWAEAASAGKVYVIYNDGRLTTGDLVLAPDPASTGVAVFIGPKADCRLGSSLAVGRFDQDAFEDLMIGVPRIAHLERRAVEGAVFGILGRATDERPQGQIILNAGEGSLASDLIIWAGDWGDRFGSQLAMGQFDGSLGLDLFVCGKPLSEGQAGSAWLFLGEQLVPSVPPVFESARPAWNRYR